ncbi:MAG: adenine methyltransferase [Sphingobacteriia bacterium]|nr:adenine methyltransferase [Sphingobacteriia bacterium]
MKNFNTNTKNNDEWLTPPKLIKALGVFDLDPCSPINRPWDTANQHYTVDDDGLNNDWHGRVWLNPPYGRDTFKWMEKLANHKSGIALIFARTETKGFHEQIWNKASSIFFFEGRIKFHYVDGTQGQAANAPSCLVSYSEEDTHAILLASVNNWINGVLVDLGR